MLKIPVHNNCLFSFNFVCFTDKSLFGGPQMPASNLPFEIFKESDECMKKPVKPDTDSKPKAAAPFQIFQEPEESMNKKPVQIFCDDDNAL